MRGLSHRRNPPEYGQIRTQADTSGQRSSKLSYLCSAIRDGGCARRFCATVAEHLRSYSGRMNLKNIKNQREKNRKSSTQNKTRKTMIKTSFVVTMKLPFFRLSKLEKYFFLTKNLFFLSYVPFVPQTQKCLPCGRRRRIKLVLNSLNRIFHYFIVVSFADTEISPIFAARNIKLGSYNGSK